MDNKKKAILAVSFGTCYEQSRKEDIGGIEQALQEAFPEYEVRRAFTSQMIINKLKREKGLNIDNVTEAVKRLITDNISQVIVQPTHVIAGEEYEKMIEQVKPFEDQLKKVVYGAPLLKSEEDYRELAHILSETEIEDTEKKTALVLMGHGSEHAANHSYEKLETILHQTGNEHCLIGTVEAMPDLEEAVRKVKKSGASKVVLLPLMIVAGDHANNDMAGDEEGSWKRRFEEEGFETECRVTGLGRLKDIKQMFVRHAKEAMEA